MRDSTGKRRPGSCDAGEGRHRLEAVRSLGHEEVDCVVFGNEHSARLWEVSENLHRSDLTVDERAEHRSEWIKLHDVSKDGLLISAQLVPKSKSTSNPKGAGRPEGGIRKAVRELPNLDGKSDEAKRMELRRDLKIASRTDESKEAARKAGLADNQRALLAIAKAAPKDAPHEEKVAAELVMIDENLKRADLTPSEYAYAVTRRKMIYEELHPETKVGAGTGGRASRTKDDFAKSAKSKDGSSDRFTKVTSAVSGKSERTVQAAAEIGRALNEDLKRTTGTSLDKTVELKALAELPEPEGKDLIDRAAAGEKVSARSPKPPPPTQPAEEYDEAAAVARRRTGSIMLAQAGHCRATRQIVRKNPTKSTTGAFAALFARCCPACRRNPPTNSMPSYTRGLDLSSKSCGIAGSSKYGALVA